MKSPDDGAKTRRRKTKEHMGKVKTIKEPDQLCPLVDNDKAASDTVIIQRKMTEYRPYLNWWAKKQLMVSESRVIL